MTSFAFIFGLMPLVLSNGVGAAGNRSIGTGAVGGLLVGTILGVFVIPILFIFFQWLQEKITGAPTNNEELLDIETGDKLIENKDNNE
jgi:HAE1 family hydrophobic/amphiphilic exporter-1